MDLKIAVFHNYMDNIGGAERVGLTLAREFGADIYTTNIDSEKIRKMGFSDVLPRIYSIGKLPINAPQRQQMALWKFSRLKIRKKYDFYIIDGDWAVSAAVNNKPSLWYIHSPIREIWDLYEYTRQHSVPWWARNIFDIWVAINRRLNRKYVKQVNICVSNSINTAARVKKYLKRDPVVIHPPIETKHLEKSNIGDYWLSVNRLITHKRVDLQLKAFSKLPGQKLVIVGSYEMSRHFLKYAKYCRRIMPKNVVIKRWVGQDELRNLFANCRGFITTSHNEDFGMNVVEAMAYGKPVIAPNEGGYKESVIPDKTGILIDNIDADKIRHAVLSIESTLKTNPKKYSKECKKQAAKFDVSIFIEKIRSEMQDYLNRKSKESKVGMKSNDKF